jgi:hypothetical protein
MLYVVHKPTGQAVFRIHGQDVFLGIHGTEKSREAYDRVIAEWLITGRNSLRPSSRFD